MNKKVLCMVEPGLATHTIFYYEDDVLTYTKKVTYDDLADYLLTLCYGKGCYDLYLSGNPTFLQGIREDLQTEEATKYSNNKIHIEVI